jgi:hypothetical protein
MGYVYLILEVNEHGDEHYKIGISKNEPEKRLKQLQTGNPNRIDILKFYKSENYKRVEKWLHSKYSSFRTLANNEWFKLPNEHVLIFEDTCKKVDETINLLLKENPFFK